MEFCDYRKTKFRCVGVDVIRTQWFCSSRASCCCCCFYCILYVYCRRGVYGMGTGHGMPYTILLKKTMMGVCERECVKIKTISSFYSTHTTIYSISSFQLYTLCYTCTTPRQPQKTHFASRFLYKSMQAARGGSPSTHQSYLVFAAVARSLRTQVSYMLLALTLS